MTRAYSDWTGLDVRDPDNPSNFVPGIYLLKRGSANTYVIKVNLNSRQIKAYYQQNATDISGFKSFDGLSINSFNLTSLQWYVVINASFFNAAGDSDPYRLPFCLKKNGTYATAGYNSYVSTPATDGYRRYFAIKNNKAYMGDAFYDTDITGTFTPSTESAMETDLDARMNYPDIFMGLDPINADKSGSSYVGRTMVGINTSQRNIVYILVASAIKQSQAVSYLQNDFGCNDIVMFDGGGSSQFRFVDVDNMGWKVTSSDNRSVPVYFAIKWCNLSLFRWY